jgi:hypothetical protein
LGDKHKILYIAAAVIFSNCANPVLPSGGSKDSIPPHLNQVDVQDRSTKSKILTLTFDEHIKITDPKEHVFIAPPGKITETRVLLTKVQISIQHPDTATSNLFSTPYLHVLPGFIKDLNEGNNYTAPICINLSHANNIDSNYTIGQIHNIIPPFKSKLTVFYIKDTAAIHTLSNVFYSTVFDHSKFIIPNTILHDSLKFILFLDDLNKNNLIDSSEYYSLYPISHDSINLNYSYCDYPKRRNFQAFRQNQHGIITGISGAKIKHNDIIYYQEDTALFFFRDTLQPVNLTDEHGFHYTISPKVQKIQTTALIEPFHDTAEQQNIWINRTFHTKFMDTITIVHYNDSIHKQLGTFIPPNQLITAKQSDKIKAVNLPTLSDSITGTTLKSDSYSITLNNQKYGNITFTRQDLDTNSYILYLNSNSSHRTVYLPVHQHSVTTTAPAGTYDCIIVNDLDDNKYFTKSSIINLSTEEPSFILQNIKISEKLDNNIIIQNTNK